MDRRSFVRKATVLGAVGVAFPGVACNRDPREAGGGDFSSNRSPAGPAREVDLVAEPTEVEIPGVGVRELWTYNGQYPGPEIRIAEGERLRARIRNRLPEPTTIHWHGVPVPNGMDGVPGVTQEAIEPGADFLYDFMGEPAGSYIYHSHVGLQLDRGLHAPLIVEENDPHVAYDAEHTLVLDDLLPGEPSMPEGGRRMMMRDETPEYEAFLVNGHPPDDPPRIEVTRGDRVRLRLMNPGSSTTFRVAVAGHRMEVTHTDGRPVEPVEVDAVEIGMGERYDVVVTADNPGLWRIEARGLDGGPEPARAHLAYRDVERREAEGPPEGLRSGRVLSLADLASVETTGEANGEPDRTLDLALRREGMMRGGWTIGGEAWPQAPPLEISPGERVRVRMTNHSPHRHPMHLHGFFFRVGDALKETVVVPGHMGRVAFEFTADEPGDWFFHCHHIYHMELGMARVFSYT